MYRVNFFYLYLFLFFLFVSSSSQAAFQDSIITQVSYSLESSKVLEMKIRHNKGCERVDHLAIDSVLKFRREGGLKELHISTLLKKGVPSDWTKLSDCLNAHAIAQFLLPPEQIENSDQVTNFYELQSGVYRVFLDSHYKGSLHISKKGEIRFSPYQAKWDKKMGFVLQQPLFN